MSKVKIEIRNHKSCITSELSPKQLNALDELMAFYVPNYQFMPLYKKRNANGKRVWDGKKHFFSPKTQLFYTGLLPYVLEFFDAKKVKVFLTDKRKHVKFTEPYDWGTWFSALKSHSILPANAEASPDKCKYQVKAIRSLWESRVKKLKFRRGIVSMGTGSGKTLTAGQLPWYVTHKKSKILYTIHRLDLANQTRKSWNRILLHQKGRIGIVGDSIFKLGRVTIAMIQSLDSILASKSAKATTLKKWLSECRVWIADEVHRADSPGYMRLANHLMKADVRVGFSGSVMRKELDHSRIKDATLMSIFGPRVFHLSSKELRDKGLLAGAHIYMIPQENAVPVHEKGKYPAYKDVYELGVVHDVMRNACIVDLTTNFMTRKLPTLVICSRVMHVKLLEKLIKIKSRLPFACLTGSESSKVRKKALKKFAAGDYRALIVSTIFDEGVDVPDVTRIVMAAGGKGGDDGTTIIQRVGRGLRKKRKGENIVRVYDFMDSEPKYLRPQARKRVRVYKDEEFVMETLPPVWSPLSAS